MGKFLWQRGVQTVITVLLMSLIIFIALQAIPGDAAIIAMGDYYGHAELQAIRAEMGLDRPAITQYGMWLAGIFRGDLGTSLRYGSPIAPEIAQRLPITFQLTILALFLSVLIGIPSGLISAAKRGKGIDRFVRFISLLGISIPNFWLGLILILFFALNLRWIPSGGYVSPGEGLVEYFKAMAGPTITLGTAMMATTMRITRAATLEALSQDYIRTAKAKGLKERKVVFKHAFKNALIPVLTVIGIQIGFLMAGSIVVETVFTLPGISRFLIGGVSSRDYPVVMATVMVISLVFLIINFIVDVIYVYVDPRVRYD